MIFTQEQIDEIKQRLSLRGIKDSELDKLDLLKHPLTGKEVITIVKDGENLRISVEDLYEEFTKYIEQSGIKEGFFNVSAYLGRLDPEFKNAAKPCTLREAVNASPPYIRKAGQMISFLDSYNMKWKTYQYIGTKDDDWGDIDLFEADMTVLQDRVDNLNSTVSNLQPEVQSAKTTAEEAKQIALGANRSITFATYKNLVQTLEGGSGVFEALYGAKAKVGQNIYIAALNVPDCWIAEVDEEGRLTPSEYDKESPTFDNDIASLLVSENGLVINSWIRLRALETQKVDLTEYDKDISNLKQNVASNTSEIGTINSKLADIEQDVQNNQSSILRLDEEKATRQELQNTAQGLGQSISSIGALAGSNNSKINTLQESVTTNSNDISELKEGKANYADIVDGTIIVAHALLADNAASADNAKNAEYATEAGKAMHSDTSTLATAAQMVKATNIEGILSDEQLSENIRTEVIYDVSERNNGAVFESLQALLSSSNLTTLIPTSVRRGGMTIRFIQGSEQSSSNKYVQYRYMGTATTGTLNPFLDTDNWTSGDGEFLTGEKVSEVGIDNEPTANSKNLINSGSVATIQNGNLKKELGITTTDLNIDDFALLNHHIANISDGYIKGAVDYKIYYLQIDVDCLIKYKLGASSLTNNAALFICNSQPAADIAFTNPIERVAYSEGSFTIIRGQYLCVQAYSTSNTYLPSLLKKGVTLFKNINIFDELGEKESDSSIEATNVWGAIEEVNSNIPQVNTIASSIKPLMVDTASFFWTHKQATNFNQDNPFKISGIANSNTLNVLSGGQTTSVLTDADKLASIVIKFDNGACKPFMLTGWGTDTLTIYPAIDTAITDGEVVPLMLDPQHLTNYGYNAYSQHLFLENPRYCEKNKFIERYGSTGVPPFSSLQGAPGRYESTRNDGGCYSCQYGGSGIFMIPYADYSTASEYGYQWEVSTNGVKGYLETYIGTCYGFYPANTFTLDTGYEIHIECWIDGVKTYEKIKDNIFIERICVPYSKSDDRVKLKVYLTQLRKQKDTLYIGPTTFWVNEIDRRNLIDKHEVVAQLFDSWGVFGAGSDYIEDENGKKWYQGQSGKELHRLINEDNGFILPYYNYSEGGMTTRWGKVWWYHNVWAFHPDVMITDFGINDYHTNMGQFQDFTDPYGNTISMATAVTATEFSQNMETLFDMCIRHNIVPIYVMCSRIGCDISYINTFVGNHAQQLSLT